MSIERRSILKSTAAAIAVAIPGAIAGCVPPVIAADGDAELLDLKRQLDCLMATWRPVWRGCNGLHDKWLQVVREREVELSEANAATLKAIQDEVGYTTAEAANSALIDQMQGLADRIWNTSPTSLAGLMAWVSAARFDCLSIRDILEPEKAEFSDRRLIQFLAEAERLCVGASA